MILLLRISILQLLRGDFFDSIGQTLSFSGVSRCPVCRKRTRLGDL